LSFGYVLAPRVGPLLTFDPPPGDLLSLRDILCPFGKDALSNPMKAILVSGRALLEQTSYRRPNETSHDPVHFRESIRITRLK